MLILGFGIEHKFLSQKSGVNIKQIRLYVKKYYNIISYNDIISYYDIIVHSNYYINISRMYLVYVDIDEGVPKIWK